MAHILRAPKGAVKKRKIVGRGPGSGLGGTAGRGNNGQNSRSGGGVRPGFEGGQMPLFRRIARRGFSNYPFKKESVVISIGQLEKRFNEGDTVNLASLIEKRLVKNSEIRVKILSDGELTKKLNVEIFHISKSAREKIEKAGGKIIQKEETKQEEAHGK